MVGQGAVGQGLVRILRFGNVRLGRVRSGKDYAAVCGLSKLGWAGHGEESTPWYGVVRLGLAWRGL